MKNVLFFFKSWINATNVLYAFYMILYIKIFACFHDSYKSKTTLRKKLHLKRFIPKGGFIKNRSKWKQ